jgi:hypothetical protein
VEQVIILRGKNAFIKGSSDGSGYGSGFSDGDGSGYGDGAYWRACIKYFASKWSHEQRKRLTTLKKAGAKICYWCSTAEGCPANGGSALPVKIGDIQKEKGPLRLCQEGTLHATLIPPKWDGQRWWIVALKGKVVGNAEKYGALEREILGECL